MVSRWLLRKCVQCGAYTLRRDRCPYCGGPVRVPHPPKFSPEDKYGKYRRVIRKQLLASGQAAQTPGTAASESSKSEEEISHDENPAKAVQPPEGYSTL